MSTAHTPAIEAPQEVTVDVDAQTAYIRLQRADVANTTPLDESESVILDFDGAGHLIGIEIIGLNTEIPIDRLAQSYQFSESLIRTLKDIQQSLRQVGVTTAGAGGDVVSNTAAPAMSPVQI